MDEYCGEYVLGNSRICLNIVADDEADAEHRADCIRQSFKVLGKLEGTVPFRQEQDTPAP